jgi:hypothetical protein
VNIARSFASETVHLDEISVMIGGRILHCGATWARGAPLAVASQRRYKRRNSHHTAV